MENRDSDAVLIKVVFIVVGLEREVLVVLVIRGRSVVGRHCGANKETEKQQRCPHVVLETEHYDLLFKQENSRMNRDSDLVEALRRCADWPQLRA